MSTISSEQDLKSPWKEQRKLKKDNKGENKKKPAQLINAKNYVIDFYRDVKIQRSPWGGGIPSYIYSLLS